MNTEELQQDSSLADDLSANIVLEDEPEQIEAKPAEVLEALEPPPKWDKRYKEAFQAWSAAPNGRDIQQTVIDLYNEQQGYATKVEQERADLRKRYEQYEQFVRPVSAALQPYQQLINELGATPDQMIRQGLGLMQALRNNPQETLQRLAREARVELGKPEDQPWVDPQVAELRNELNRIQREQRQIQEMAIRNQRERVIQEVNAQLQAFVEAKDDSGEQLHPHVSNPQVEKFMAALVKDGFTLDEAYAKACYAIDEVRENMQQSREAARLKAAEKEAKQAKEASKRVKTGSAGKAQSERSLREDIEAAMRAA